MKDSPVARQAAASGLISRIFYGWWIVFAASSINVYISGAYIYGFSALFGPIATEFKWSYALISLALSFRGVETGFFAPILGFLADRYGPRRLMMLGAVAAGAGAMWLSRVHSFPEFFGAVLLLAFGGSSCLTNVVPMTAVANWFHRKIGKAAALMTFGSGLGGLLVPGVVWMIDAYGWRTAVVVIGVGFWVICLPLSLLARHKPEQYGQLPDGGPETKPAAKRSTPPGPAAEFGTREALRTRAFWLLLITTFLAIVGVAVTIIHVIPYLESAGFSRRSAGFVVTALSLTTIVGRLLFGWLADVWDKGKLLMATYALEAAGLLIFAYVRDVWTLIPFLLTFAVAQGGQATVRFAIQRDYFGRSSFGSIQGIMMIGGTTAMVVGPPLAGLVFDRTGSYFLVWVGLAVASAAGVPLCWMIKRPRKKESVAAG